MANKKIVYILTGIVVLFLAGNMYYYAQASHYYSSVLDVIGECQCNAFCSFMGQPNILGSVNYTRFCEEVLNESGRFEISDRNEQDKNDVSPAAKNTLRR